MTVRCKSDEDEWNAALRLVSEKLTSLKTISVGIDQKFPYDEAAAFESYKNPSKEGNTFLRALRELEELPLTNGTIVVFSSESHRPSAIRYCMSVRRCGRLGTCG